jgi:outer membrane protein assembly factor BamA
MKTSIHAKYQNADEVSFFGIGNDSLKENETAFTFIPKSIDVTESFWLSNQFHIGGSVAYLDIDTKPGNSATVPSIETEFTPAEVPGLGTDPQLVVGNLFAEFDWRQSPGWTSRGGYYRVDWYDYNERDGANLDFHRWDFELVQHIPILRANQILAFRALATITDVSDPQQIPHFLLPKLGGGSELRGFRDFRFQDRHRMLLTAEYRWTPSKFMDMVVFYETGKVAANTRDLDFSDLHNCYGIGARFHTPAFTAFRVEFAHSVEGNRIILSGGAAF